MPNAPGPAALLALSGIVALGVFRLWNPAQAPVPENPAAFLPPRVGALISSGDDPVDPVVLAALPSARLQQKTYIGPHGERVQATLIVGGDRTALHDPRSCMVGAGWKLEKDRTETLPQSRVSVRRCELVHGAARFETLYVYATDDGGSVASPTAIRWRMLGAALRGGRERPVRFLRLLQPVAPNSGVRLPELAAALWPSLSSGRKP